MSVALKASVGVPLEQSRMVHGALGKLPPQASPMVNRPAFKLPAAIQRSADSGRKRPAGAPLRRVLGSKRLHYFTASTPTRSPSEATPDDRHGNRPQGGGVEHEGITARNLSLDLGGAESPLIGGQSSDLITPSPMSIVPTPRAPHKYFDQSSDVTESRGATSTASSSPVVLPKASSALLSGTRTGTRSMAAAKNHSHWLAHQGPASGGIDALSPAAQDSQAAEPSSQTKTPRAPKRSLFENGDASSSDSSSSP